MAKVDYRSTFNPVERAAMATIKRSSKGATVEGLVASDPDLMKALMKQALQEVLEAEMNECCGAGRASAPPAGRVTAVATTALAGDAHREAGAAGAAGPQRPIFEGAVRALPRSEKALVAALVEMYVQGVSTRKVKAITEELCGHSFFGLGHLRRSTRAWTRR